MKKITPVFGPQELFKGAPGDSEFAIQYLTSPYSEDPTEKIHFIQGVERALRFVSSCNVVEIAHRVIEEMPEPKRWTVADQKAGRLPEVGAKYSAGGFVLVCIFIDAIGDVWGSSIGGNVKCHKAKYISPIETPDEKAARLEDEYLNRIAEHYPEVDLPTARVIYSLSLSGSLPPVQAKAGDE